MKYIFLCLLFTGNFAQATELKGYVETNQALRERIFDQGGQYEVGDFIGVRYSDFENNLLDILGTYKSSGVTLGFKNGQPNSLNILVWKMMFSQLSDKISGLCIGGDSTNFSVDFSTQMTGLCKWPAATARSEESLKTFWTILMGYDAPEEEFLAFRDFFLSDQWSQARPNDVVWAMSYSILMNPYFLLRD